MAGRRDLDIPHKRPGNLKDQLAWATLRNVRQQGHIYVELRADGNKLVFFCTLCLSPCYSEFVLYSHLNGSLHSEMLAAAATTLLKPNPWPFNDGVLFFHDSSEQDELSLKLDTDEISFLETNELDEGNVPALTYPGNTPLSIDQTLPESRDCIGRDSNSSDATNSHIVPSFSDMVVASNKMDLIVPGVLHRDEVTDLGFKHIGVAQIAARLIEKDGSAFEFCRIWCEWLGEKDTANGYHYVIPDHEFAVITFPYNYNLGRKGWLIEAPHLLLPSPYLEHEESDCSRNMKRKSFSDPEDISYSLSNLYDSSGEESQSSNLSKSRTLLDGNDDQVLDSGVIVSKSARRQLRRRRRVASERICDICQLKMLPGKDVAALLNTKTGKVACSSRNQTGAFHVFHISCLIQWILLCEVEAPPIQPEAPKVRCKFRKKVGMEHIDFGKNSGDQNGKTNEIRSVFCPECQGTGKFVAGDEKERPSVTLSDIFKFKIKVSEVRNGWIKSPEMLENCSIGFCFPPKSENSPQESATPFGYLEESVTPMKLLHFYRAHCES